MSLFARNTVRTASPRAAALVLLLAVGHLPLLAEFARQTWHCPHRELFLLLVAGAAFLSARVTAPASPGRRVGYLLLAASWLALAAAGVLDSPSLGTVAALGTLAAVAVTVGGWPLLREHLPALVLLGLAVPLQTELYHKLIVALQGWTARRSSEFLDLLGAKHVLAGNVLEMVSGRRLFVEEACSGIQSLSAVLACTLFFAFATRRSAVHAVLLTAGAGVCALGMNIIRVTGITLLQRRLDPWWAHDGASLVAFGFTLLAILSTDQLLLFFTAPGPAPWREEEPEAPVPLAPARAWSRRPAWWFAGILFATLGVAQAILFWPTTATVLAADEGIPEQLAALGEDALPAEWGTWRRSGFEVVHRDRGHSYGDDSRVWRYQRGTLVAAISLDYPFGGWHELVGCYEGQGWLPAERQVVTDGECLAAAVLHKQMECHAYLWFGLFDCRGCAVLPAPEGFRERLQARWQALQSGMMRWQIDRGGKALDTGQGRTGPTYQVQLLVECYAPLTAADRADALAFFRHCRDELRRQGFPTEGETP